MGYLSPDADDADYATDSAFGRAAPNGHGSTDKMKKKNTSDILSAVWKHSKYKVSLENPFNYIIEYYAVSGDWRNRIYWISSC